MVLSAAEHESEESAVLDCLDQLWAAYKHGDAKTIADLYHPQANLVLRGQEIAIGQAAIELEYAKLIELDPVRTDTNVKQAFRIHLVTSDLAVVDAAAALTKNGRRRRGGKAGGCLLHDCGSERVRAMAAGGGSGRRTRGHLATSSVNGSRSSSQERLHQPKVLKSQRFKRSTPKKRGER